jgi:hypothetical protein
VLRGIRLYVIWKARAVTCLRDKRQAQLEGNTKLCYLSHTNPAANINPLCQVAHTILHLTTFDRIARISLKHFKLITAQIIG